MERIWLSQYPPGIPAEVNLHEFSSLRGVLLRSCHRCSDLPAYSNICASMTYAELDRASRDSAAYLHTAPELAHQIKDSGAAAIMVLEKFVHTLRLSSSSL